MRSSRETLRCSLILFAKKKSSLRSARSRVCGTATLSKLVKHVKLVKHLQSRLVKIKYKIVYFSKLKLNFIYWVIWFFFVPFLFIRWNKLIAICYSEWQEARNEWIRVEVNVHSIAQKKRTRNKIERTKQTQRSGTSAAKSTRVTFVCTTLVWLCCTRGSWKYQIQCWLSLSFWLEEARKKQYCIWRKESWILRQSVFQIKITSWELFD